ncbi:carbon monoxide dehydrogenase subunit G [Cryobacterium mesophilum]|nr:carbon monoxide dehydrogenase subunit G [Terrimesophilobacter mesophilus]
MTENTTNNPIALALGGGAADSVAIVGAAGHGTASASGTTVTYTPATDYVGQDSFQYTATNTGGTSSPATVTITVEPSKPVAGAVSIVVGYNSSDNPVTLNLSGGLAESVEILSAPSHGSASATGTSITYTPASNYSGGDSFSYTATNAGGTSSAATVTITVIPAPPSTADVMATVTENSSNNPITLILGGGAADSVAIVGAAGHGTASASGTTVTYTPATNYVGQDAFQYTATNTGGTSSPATVTITVVPPTPVAGAVSIVVAYNSSGNPVTLNLSGGLAESVEILSAPSHGIAGASGTSMTYTPASNYSGGDSFLYAATNAGGTSSAATVTVTVLPAPPSTADVMATVAENSSNNPITLILGGGAADSVAIVGAAGHGTASASGTTITYTPATNYVGSDVFTYSASNAGGTSATATVLITVSPVFVSLIANYGDADGKTVDAEGTPLAVLTITNTTTHAVLSNGDLIQEGQDVQVTWNLASGYSVTSTTATHCVGTHSNITDGIDLGAMGSDGNQCTFSLEIGATSAPGVAATSAVVASNSSGNSIPLLVSGPAATSIDAGGATHGTVTVTGHSATYTPDAGYSGQDSFTYTGTNDAGTSAEATVTITVTPPIITLSSSSVNAGDDIVVGGTGFAPNEGITIVLHSSPVTLGTFHANIAGELSATITIPKAAAGGNHTLVFDAETSGTFGEPLTVRAAGSQLAFTGLSGGLWIKLNLAALLATVGIFFVVTNRRRQRPVAFLE